MPVVAVDPELYKRVEETAQDRQESIDEILAEALRLYLWEQERRKISEESQIYRQLHVQLKDQYLGQYIAMRNGKVIDADPDFDAPRKRIRQRFGRKPVMMTRVEEVPEPLLTRRGFRMETGAA